MPKSIQIKRSSRLSDISAWHTLTLDDFAKNGYSMKNVNRTSIESVYSVIEKHSGRVTTRHIEEKVGLDIGTVRYAIKYLTKERKIRRVKGLGTNKIEFYYEVCQSV